MKYYKWQTANQKNMALMYITRAAQLQFVSNYFAIKGGLGSTGYAVPSLTSQTPIRVSKYLYKVYSTFSSPKIRNFLITKYQVLSHHRGVREEKCTVLSHHKVLSHKPEAECPLNGYGVPAATGDLTAPPETAADRIPPQLYVVVATNVGCVSGTVRLHQTQSKGGKVKFEGGGISTLINP